VIEREDVGESRVLRLARGPVNAMDLELVRAIRRVLPVAGRPTRRGPVVITGGRPRLLRRGRPAPAARAAGRSTSSGSCRPSTTPSGRPVRAGQAGGGGGERARRRRRGGAGRGDRPRLMADGEGRIGVPEIVVGGAVPAGAAGDRAASPWAMWRPAGWSSVRRPTRRPRQRRSAGVTRSCRRTSCSRGRSPRPAGWPPTSRRTPSRHQGPTAREHIQRMGAYTDEQGPVAALWARRVADGWDRRLPREGPPASAPDPHRRVVSRAIVASTSGGQVGAGRDGVRGRPAELGGAEVGGVGEQAAAAGLGGGRPSSAKVCS
jgi:enoyl-CoA hydratase